MAHTQELAPLSRGVGLTAFDRSHIDLTKALQRLICFHHDKKGHRDVPLFIASASHLRTRGLSPLLADVPTCVLTFVATAIETNVDLLTAGDYRLQPPREYYLPRWSRPFAERGCGCRVYLLYCDFLFVVKTPWCP